MNSMAPKQCIASTQGGRLCRALQNSPNYASCHCALNVSSLRPLKCLIRESIKLQTGFSNLLGLCFRAYIQCKHLILNGLIKMSIIDDNPSSHPPLVQYQIENRPMSQPEALLYQHGTAALVWGVRYPIRFNSMFEFCQKTIHSIFDSILLYPRFNSKYYSIQKILLIQFKSLFNSIVRGSLIRVE